MPQVIPWQGPGKPTELAIRRILWSEALMSYSWSNTPYDVYGVHVHTYDKVIYVVEGSITFALPSSGERVVLNAGDGLEFEAGVGHGAEVGSEGVVCLEAHR